MFVEPDILCGLTQDNRPCSTQWTCAQLLLPLLFLMLLQLRL
jgi:hypothetical protein